MKITFYSDIRKFCDLCFPFLAKNEAENNLLFGILKNLRKNPHTYSEEYSPILISIADDNVLKLISIRTPPYNQLISYTEDLATIPSLVEELSNKIPDIPGILGFKDGALKFGQLWAKRHGKKLHLDMNERIYQLEEVNSKTLGSHEFVPATRRDKPLILEWMRAFVKEAVPNQPPEEPTITQKRIDQAIERRMIYFLKVNNKIVSMARKAGTTPNGQTINAVYTPPKHRRHGYGTEVVAKLSQNILDEGKTYCFLFTDLANPTSNKIYQTVGYKPIIDVDVYLFQ
ncbi:MAG: GNAT family N-acetyltransferase [Promethearchaeota archaeon]